MDSINERDVEVLLKSLTIANNKHEPIYQKIETVKMLMNEMPDKQRLLYLKIRNWL